MWIPEGLSSLTPRALLVLAHMASLLFSLHLLHATQLSPFSWHFCLPEIFTAPSDSFSYALSSESNIDWSLNCSLKSCWKPPWHLKSYILCANKTRITCTTPILPSVDVLTRHPWSPAAAASESLNNWAQWEESHETNSLGNASQAGGPGLPSEIKGLHFYIFEFAVDGVSLTPEIFSRYHKETLFFFKVPF